MTEKSLDMRTFVITNGEQITACGGPSEVEGIGPETCQTITVEGILKVLQREGVVENVDVTCELCCNRQDVEQLSKANHTCASDDCAALKK